MVLPAVFGNGEQRPPAGPDELAAIVSEVQALRSAAGRGADPYDVIIEAGRSREFVQLEPAGPHVWAAAGVTWWIERWRTIEAGPDGRAEVRRRIESGPPSVSST